MFDHHDLEHMLQAVSICLVLTGIHGYLGIHVLERKVIFVDLAMAQIAALGATVAFALGYRAHEQPFAVYLFSLAFTLTGAAVFSLTRMRAERVPQEAFIGIIYATAAAVAILILTKSESAGDQLRGILVGDILQARWPQIGATAAIYAAVGVFHWFFRDRFFRISLDPEGAYRDGLRVRLWDFLFYATFGVVITSSVAIAGVLLVFSFLVVPACIAVLFVESVARRILVAWGVGTVVTVAGIGFTFYEGNFQPGPVVVAAFAAALVVAGLLRYVTHAERKGAALLRTGAGAAAVALAVAGLGALRRPEPAHEEHAHESEYQLLVEELRSDDETRQLHAIDHFLAEPDRHAVPDLLALLARTPSDRVLEHLAATLRKLDDPRAAAPLAKATERPNLDPALRFAVAEARLDLRDASALGDLVRILGDEAAPRLARIKSLRLFDRLTRKGFGYEIDGDPERLERIRRWWAEHGSHIKWRESTGRFE